MILAAFAEYAGKYPYNDDNYKKFHESKCFLFCWSFRYWFWHSWHSPSTKSHPKDIICRLLSSQPGLHPSVREVFQKIFKQVVRPPRLL